MGFLPDNFGKVVALCAKKDLPRFCLLNAMACKFACTRKMAGLMADYISEHYTDNVSPLGDEDVTMADCELLGNVRQGHCYKKTKEIVQKAEDEVKSIYQKLNVDYQCHCPPSHNTTFDPYFVRGPGLFHDETVSWYHKHGFNTNGSQRCNIQELEEASMCSECGDIKIRRM